MQSTVRARALRESALKLGWLVFPWRARPAGRLQPRQRRGSAGSSVMPVKVQAVQEHPIGDASEYVAR